jgi:hypothetical protein
MMSSKRKKVGTLMVALGMCVFGLASCEDNGDSSSSSASSSSSSSSTAPESSSSSSSSETAYYDSIADRASFDTTNENNINEELTGGVLNDNVWNTLDGTWQNDSSSYPHNGVRSRNLFYVTKGDKTLLGFKGRGIYNSDSDTITSSGYREPEGACIISKNHLGPGRYEINMAAMPREGGVTAMWTYCTVTGSEATSQNEIDIEIGGNTSQTYMHEWCTSWTNHTTKDTENVDVSKICYLNDGIIHKYTFDWYTNYENTGVKRVDWFIDGILIASVEGDVVTDYEMPLWIGLWFPNWSSVAAFDTDYLLVESIKYSAFDSSQDYEDCRAKSGYTQTVPSLAGIQTISYETTQNVNKLSNGEFESLDICKQDQTYMGWFLDTASSGSISLSDDAPDDSSVQLTAGSGTGSVHGEYLCQTITNAYGGYKYNYSFDAKKGSDDAVANIELHYKTISDKAISSATQKIAITNTEWTTYSGSLVMPDGAGILEIDLCAENGSTLFDNASLQFTGLSS